jgi:hypothetical protein
MRRRSTDPAGAAHLGAAPGALRARLQRRPVACPPPGPDDIADSYVRFSSLPQEEGDSVRRQVDDTKA